MFEYIDYKLKGVDWGRDGKIQTKIQPKIG